MKGRSVIFIMVPPWWLFYRLLGAENPFGVLGISIPVTIVLFVFWLFWFATDIIRSDSTPLPIAQALAGWAAVLAGVLIFVLALSAAKPDERDYARIAYFGSLGFCLLAGIIWSIPRRTVTKPDDPLGLL